MSKALREAFLKGIEYADNNPLCIYGTEELKKEIISRYPDRPCSTVREIVAQHLKDNGYDGLTDGRNCFCDGDEGCLCFNCRPGVLVDGKIVERK